MPMNQDAFVGFIKLHVLHHAAGQPVYGLWLIDELREHGYRSSPGTLYPTLHQLERSGLLRCKHEKIDGKIRKYYHITAKGKLHLQRVKRQLAELVDEIFEGESLKAYLRPR